MRLNFVFASLLFCLSAPVLRAQSTDRMAPTTVLDTVVVSGELPGPALWKVSKNDHIMWVLGTLSPVPKKMVWQSARTEAVIAGAQEILVAPGVTVSSGKGFFGSLFLLPSLLGARKNPDKQTLQSQLPAETYGRWLVLKKKYLGRDRAVEKRRPIFAAYALYEKAIDRADLTNSGFVSAVVQKVAKRGKIPITRPLVKIKLDDPRGLIKEFKNATIDDVQCFTLTLRHLEGDLETMKDRANAWATGDIALLEQLEYTDQGRACIDAMLDVGALQKGGLTNLPQRVEDEWLKAAEAALAKNKVTFATLPMRELVEADGYLALLANRGYRVEAPQIEPLPE